MPPLTPTAGGGMDALTYKTGEGDRTLLLFPSFENGEEKHSTTELAKTLRLGLGDYQTLVARSLVANKNAPWVKCGGPFLTDASAFELFTPLCYRR